MNKNLNHPNEYWKPEEYVEIMTMFHLNRWNEWEWNENVVFMNIHIISPSLRQKKHHPYFPILLSV